MSEGSLTQNLHLDRILQRCRRQIRMHAAIIGLALVLTAVISCVLVATALDYVFGLPEFLRAIFLVATVTVVGVVAWRRLLQPLLTPIPDEELGAAVDISSPELHEGLATLVSLQRADVTASEAGSDLMRRRLAEQTSGQLHQLRNREFVDSKQTAKRWGVAGLLMVAALVPAIVWTSGSQLLVSRLVMPFANLETARNLYFDVADGDRTVARGSDVRIAATPKWRTETAGERPENVSVQLEASDGNTETLPMNFDEVSGNYVATLANIANSVHFRVSGGGATSKLFAINVVNAPEIQAAVMTATPPVYIGRAIERFDGMVGTMEVFERSELEVLLEFSKPVERVGLVWQRRDARPISETAVFDRQFDHVTGEEVINLEIDDVNPDEFNLEAVNPEDLDPDAPLVPQHEPLAERIEGQLTADRMGATFHFQADVGGDFVFEVKDEFDLSNGSEPDRTLEVAYDLPPELTVTGLRSGDGYRANDIVAVNCVSVDDVGVGHLELHYRVGDDVREVLAATDFDRGSQTVRHSFRLQLSDLNLKHGDDVSIRVRTADERPTPGPQEVWSKDLTLKIDDNAKAAGARALEEETQQMTGALKQLEEQLKKDKQKAEELKSESQKSWTGRERTETSRLSEKEQQQGKVLAEIAKEVATHPLMQESAQKLQDISEQLREQIPKELDKAVDADKRQASNELNKAAEQLQQAARDLAEQIEEIEKRAQQEQDLAELNRLALEAEQLAKDSEQLDKDRRQPENQPEEMSDQDWQQELDQRQQELSREREDLSKDLGQLLQDQPELLESAQQAQREQLAELSEKVRELAEQQNRVATGVNEEAKEAARDARQIAKQLQQAKQAAEKLNAQVKQKDEDASPPDVQPLQDAIKQLQQGNLAEPQQSVDEAAKQFRDQSQQQSQDAAVADQSQHVADRLEEISKQIESLKQQRGATDAPGNNEQAAADGKASKGQERGNKNDEAAANESQPADRNAAQPQPDPVGDMLKQVEALAAAAKQNADRLNADPAANSSAKKNAEAAAQQAKQGSQEAAAGQFNKSAAQLRKAAQATKQGAAKLNQPALADQQKQMQGLGDELNRTADMLQDMQQDDAAQAAAQQGTQRRIAESVDKLPQQLSDMSERLNIPELQMAAEAEQTQSAQQAAAQAQQSSQQASSQLQQGQLQQAGQAGKQTAQELDQLAELAQQAGKQKSQQDSPIPSEVGESVADALQDLQQAASAMKQNSNQKQAAGEKSQSAEQGANAQQGQQPGEGDPSASTDGQPGAQGQPGQNSQPGDQSQSGQPGQPQPGDPKPGSDGQPGQPSGSQQLSEAAKALAQAAKDSLPQQFTPGQTSDGDASSAGRAAMGNAAMWDGRTPDSSNAPADSRDWGKLNGELDTVTSDRRGISRDSEYESLIRMYFREVAKATSEQSDK